MRRNVRASQWLRRALIPLALLTMGADSTGGTPGPVQRYADGPETEPIAIVDGEELSLQRFNDLWEAYRKGFGTLDGHIPDGVVRTNKHQLAERLIDERLIERAAEQERIVITDQEVEAELASARKRFSSPEAFDTHVASFPLGLDGLRQQLRVERLREGLIAHRAPAPLTDKDLQLAYERHESRFRAPDFLVVEEILVGTTPTMPEAEVQARRNRAQEIHDRALVHGVDFTALKKTASSSARNPAKETIILTPASVPSEAWLPLTDVELQGVSMVTQTKQGFHVFKVKEKGPLVRQPFERIKGRVNDKLEEMRRGVLLMNLQKELRRRALIKNLLAERLGPSHGTPAP